jgi:hypothetical protein
LPPDTPIAVVQSIDRGIELIVAANRRQKKLIRLQVVLRDLLARREKWQMDSLYPIALLPSDPPTAEEQAAIAAEKATREKLWKDARTLDDSQKEASRRLPR